MPVSGEIRWARRVPQHKIRRLYTLDAKGIVDEELIDEVGYAMYARCDSIRAVTAASVGRARCHGCGAVIRHQWERDEPMVCGECGWRTTWREYLRSYQGKQLHGGAGFPAFVQFHERWPAARTPRDKMLLIDGLIHALHVNTQKQVLFAHPAACNIIEGRMRDVVALLDELAYGDLSTPGLCETHAEWKRIRDASAESMKQHLERQRAGQG